MHVCRWYMTLTLYVKASLVDGNPFFDPNNFLVNITYFI